MATRNPLTVIDGVPTIIPATDTTVIVNTVMGFFGDGSDGDVTVSTTITLSRDMYYDDLTVTSTGRVRSNGYRIFVRGTLNIASGGSVDAGGNDGGTNAIALSTALSPQSGANATGAGNGSVFGSQASGGNGGSHSGANGAAGGNIINGVGGKGGAGGAGAGVGSGTGGAAGTVSAPAYQPGYALPEILLATFQNLASGPPGTATGLKGGTSGGGGGYGGTYFNPNPYPAGGGAGGPGGVLILVAYNIINNGTIHANGGAGGAGTPNVVDGKYGGGGGGGGGGYCAVLYRFHTGNSPTANGGAGGATAGGGSVAGSNGTAGKLIFIPILLFL